MTSAVSGRSLSVQEVAQGSPLFQDAMSCVQRRFGRDLEHRVEELVRAKRATVSVLTESADSERALAVLAQSTQLSADGNASEIVALVNRHPSSWAKRGYGSRLLAVAERAARCARADLLTVRDNPEMVAADRAWLHRRGFQRAEAQSEWIKRLNHEEVRTPSPQKRDEIPLGRKRAAETEAEEAAPPFKLKRRDPQQILEARAAREAETSSTTVFSSVTSSSAAPVSTPQTSLVHQVRRVAPGVRGGRGGFERRGFIHSSRGTHPSQALRMPLRMTLKEPYLSMIMRGQKTWEGRLNRGAFARCRVGEEMVFFNHTGEVRVRIDEIQYSPSFEAMVRGAGYQHLVPNVASEEEAVRIYRSIYGVQDQGCGCVALRLTVLPTRS